MSALTLIIIGSIVLLGATAISIWYFNSRRNNTQVTDTSVTTSHTRITERSTQFPIEKVYEFLKKDFSKQGYDDATIKPDDVHREENVQKIRQSGKDECNKAVRQYHNDIEDLKARIKLSDRDGFLATSYKLNAQKEKYSKDIQTIEDKILDDLENNKDLSIYVTYRNGFNRRIEENNQAVANKYGDFNE